MPSLILINVSRVQIDRILALTGAVELQDEDQAYFIVDDDGDTIEDVTTAIVSYGD